MKKETFQKLLAEHTERTDNIRAFRTWSYSGVDRVPDEITTEIGRIVTLLQETIDAGYLCFKENEYLMVYNFQPLHISDDVYLCSLDAVIKPLNEINELGNNAGIPLQLVINGTTGQIGNNAYGLAVILGEEAEDEAEIGEEVPLVYGNYKDESYSESSFHDFASKLEYLRATTEAFQERELEKQEALDELAEKVNGTDIYFSFHIANGFDKGSMPLLDSASVAQASCAMSALQAVENPSKLIQQLAVA